MPLLGLIGYPLSHSFSQEYFRKKFRDLQLHDWDYQLFPIKNISELPGIIRQNEDLQALNVTIPHKQSVLSYCDSLSEEVKAIGAANLLLIDRMNSKPALKAFNTDSPAFAESLRTWYKDKNGKALVLGNGGSSKAIQYALQKMNIGFDVTGRSLDLDFESVDLSLYELVINCTPLGMNKPGTDFENELLPLNYEQVHAGQYFYDLVYNPAETAMMKQFARRGATVRNGLEMLHLQADLGWGVVRSKK
jgi:shikimate dehydrogenase